jgi:uncharacterized zinc-type alcohol dehydrogenase-like protein
MEQYCSTGFTLTYGSVDDTGARTQGGYSDHIIVREEFVVRIPESLDPAAAAPLLCAGITMYSPLRHHGAGPGRRVGIAGFGGLGDAGVKLAKALGADVTVLTTSHEKAAAARVAGADDVVHLADHAALQAAQRTLHMIISTVPQTHDVTPYLQLLTLEGSYVIVGAIEPMLQPYNSGDLIGRRASISGSGIGGIRETQELLDFCAERRIMSTIETVSIEAINDVYDRMAAGAAAHRFVIDMASLR